MLLLRMLPPLLLLPLMIIVFHIPLMPPLLLLLLVVLPILVFVRACACASAAAPIPQATAILAIAVASPFPKCLAQSLGASLLGCLSPSEQEHAPFTCGETEKGPCRTCKAFPSIRKICPPQTICSFSGSNRKQNEVFRPSIGYFGSTGEAEAPTALVGPDAL